MATNPRLKVLPDGPFIEIDGDALYLGRDCILVTVIDALSKKMVSNRHCCIKHEPDGLWTLEDLKSTNGTWLHNDRLGSKTALVSGDVFSLGRLGPKFQCELPLPVNPNATMREDDIAEAATMLEAPEGSASRPYKVGRTPEVALRHERTCQEFSAKGYTIVLGRDANSVQILIRSDEEKHISSRHAEIQFRAGGVVVLRDLGSRNGTWLNDRPVKVETPVRVGDRLVLGAPATTLTVLRLAS
jgi:pSer/pThr/pTyr-binding forkhead associated (FHA) protein